VPLPPNIRLSVTLPSPGDRAAVEQAVRRAIGDRSGDWRVHVIEPQNASFWHIVVDGPGGFQWVRKIDGPNEQNAEYIGRLLAKAIAERLPTFGVITDTLNRRWSQSKQCPICGTEEWSVSGIPYALQQIGSPNAILPLYPVTCTSCGHTILFNAFAAGLLPERP
jgi:hypothetical protein